MRAKLLTAMLFMLGATIATADHARVVNAKVQAVGKVVTIAVTLRHNDTGWDDYADGWRVELSNGQIIGNRVLAHPHVNEQPFTRSLRGVAIPSGEKRIFIRARTLTGGWSNQRYAVDVSKLNDS